MKRRRTGLAVMRRQADERRFGLGFYPPSAVSIIDCGSPAATARASMASRRSCSPWVVAGSGSELGSSFSIRGMSASRLCLDRHQFGADPVSLTPDPGSLEGPEGSRWGTSQALAAAWLWLRARAPWSGGACESEQARDVEQHDVLGLVVGPESVREFVA